MTRLPQRCRTAVANNPSLRSRAPPGGAKFTCCAIERLGAARTVARRRVRTLEVQETQAKRSWKRAHLQDGAHAWRARRPLSTAANNHSSPWNKRRAQQVRVGDRTGAFISSEKPHPIAWSPRDPCNIQRRARCLGCVCFSACAASSASFSAASCFSSGARRRRAVAALKPPAGRIR